MLHLPWVPFLVTKKVQNGTYVACRRNALPGKLSPHRTTNVMLVSTANINVQWQIPEAAAEQNMDLEPHWLVAAVVFEKRNL